MQSPQRRQHHSVIQRLLDQPHRFDLIQSLRMLDLWLRRNGIAHEAALPRHVRFRNSVSMNFPASQIESLSAVGEIDIDTDQDLQSALAGGQLYQLSITPAYLGFFGVNGVMPNHYTDGIASQILIKKFEGARAFFDIFSNRLLNLHYQAWAKYRIHYRLDAQGRDVLLPMQLALAGVRRPSKLPAAEEEAARDDSIIEDEFIAHYAAVLRHRPVSPRVIAGVLSEYFALPIQVEQFVGCWDNLADKDIFKLGVQNHVLGEGVILGTRRWDRQFRVRLRVGPLSRADFDRFLPGGENRRTVEKLLALFPLPSVEFDMCLVLRAADVLPVALGDQCNSRLGLGAFLVTQPSTKDRDDIVFKLDV
ncbi:type VI secretion system baseplate subunit TssG [Rugamonas rubra]|uniref:Type VI secretion system protein ImpH n=1 Tax=Rugamonas rubra TaxID=758825 RepID=A0A1I4NTE6_9BURK|nr:type VI secretion system baseplate subunit TssG [Rugamonas rubra]SFM18675.1 type VI secretion system protein ImpH [Rugamonas rubra]